MDYKTRTCLKENQQQSHKSPQSQLLGRLKQKDHKFKASFDYQVSSQVSLVNLVRPSKRVGHIHNSRFDDPQYHKKARKEPQ